MHQGMAASQWACPSVSVSDLFIQSNPTLLLKEILKSVQYAITYRFERLSPQLWIWLVFGLAACLDGFSIARIGAHGFRYPSPIGYLTGIWLLGLSSLWIMVLPMIPVVFPMLLFEGLALLFAGGLMISARNLQKRL
jgi:hypothetical protein